MSENQETAQPTRTFKPEHLPVEYDHVGQKYESPLVDAALVSIRERIQGDTEAVKSIDFHPIISSEIQDVQEQQRTYEQKHPEWKEQKTLVDKVDRYFFNHPSHKTLDVSIMPNADEEQRYKTGKEPGVLSYSFERTSILSSKIISHSFEKSIDRLQAIQDAALKIITEEHVTDSERTSVLNYLAQNYRRWEQKEQEAIEGTEAHKAAKSNRDIFTSLFHKMRDPKDIDVVSEAEMITRFAVADRETDKKEAFRRNFRSKPSARHKARMRPPTRKK